MNSRMESQYPRCTPGELKCTTIRLESACRCPPGGNDSLKFTATTHTSWQEALLCQKNASKYQLQPAEADMNSRMESQYARGTPGELKCTTIRLESACRCPPPALNDRRPYSVRKMPCWKVNLGIARPLRRTCACKENKGSLQSISKAERNLGCLMLSAIQISSLMHHNHNHFEPTLWDCRRNTLSETKTCIWKQMLFLRIMHRTDPWIIEYIHEW